MTNIAWKNLGHQRVRFALSTGGVAFAVMLILIVSGLYAGILTQATDYARHVDADLWVSQAGTPDSLVQSQSVLPAALGPKLRRVTGVADAVPVLTRPLIFPLGGAEANLFLVGVDGETSAGWPRAARQAGLVPAGGEVLVDRVFARLHGLRAGDVLEVGRSPLRIAGVVSGGNALVYQYAWGHLDDVAPLFEADGAVSHFLVRTDGTPVQQVAAALVRDVPGLRVRTTDALADAEAARLGGGFRPMLLVLVFIALAVGTATVGLIIYTATVERAREYGVLKAIGFSNRRLYRIVFQQSLIAAGAGFATGCALAFAVAELAELAQPVFVATIGGKDVAFTAAATAVMAVIASFVPARPIARLHPAEVFRA